MRSPATDLAAALDEILRGQKIGNHLWPVVTRGFRRLGAERAVPILKKIAADKTDLARRIAEIVSAITVSDLDPRPEAQAAKE